MQPEIRVACPTAEGVREVLFNADVKEVYPIASKKLHFERFVAGLAIKHAEDLAYLMRESDAMIMLMREGNTKLTEEVKRLAAANFEVTTLKMHLKDAEFNNNNFKQRIIERDDSLGKAINTIKELEAQIKILGGSVDEDKPSLFHPQPKSKSKNKARRKYKRRIADELVMQNLTKDAQQAVDLS